MDSGQSLSEEHARNRSGSDNGRLSEIVFRDADRYSVEDIRLICPMLLRAWLAVNDEDLSRLVTYQFEGREIQVPEVEATLYAYFTYGCQVRMALQGEQLVAIMIYLRVFDDTIAIRLSFVSPSHRKLGVSHALVDSLAPKPTIVLFQTRNDKPPERVHAFTGVRRVKFSSSQHLENWMMNWETKV